MCPPRLKHKWVFDKSLDLGSWRTAQNPTTDKNTQYNPHWKAVHDFHHDERARPGNEKERDYHNEICFRCLDTYQHGTVRHYVQWVLKNSGRDDEYDFIILTSVDMRENEKHVFFFEDGNRTRDANLIFLHIGQLAFQFVEQGLGKDFEEFANTQLKS